jgi:alkylhydroperoxidase family enzyme
MSCYAHLVQRMREAILEAPAETEPGLRQAVAARTAELSGGPPSTAGEIPADLRGYVDAIARHAYRLTDEDVEALRRAGWSEGAIFELSISAALGAGLARLDRGLAALRGGGS